MVFPSLAIFGYYLFFEANLLNVLVLLPAFLWMLHYIHRVLIFPLQIRTARKKIPVLIVLLAFIFNVINGFLNGYWFVQFASDYRSGLLINLPALSFLVWTLINLITRALDHHRWYIKEFPEYDKERMALIPFLL